MQFEQAVMDIPMKMEKTAAGKLGLSAVVVFIAALLIFGTLNAEFSFFQDYVSKLGAKGEPNSLWWNAIGFVLVGLLLFAFGLAYGLFLKDRLLSIFLSLFGLGFAFTAIPMDMEETALPVSKAHIIAICLGLAFWLFGLSRMGYNQALEKRVRNRANVTAILLVGSIIGYALGIWSMPITHRLVFGIVFGWTAITSLELVVSKPIR